MIYRYALGQWVIWRGGWGSHPPRPARIVGMGEKNDSPVYDLENGHWAYEDQLEPMREAQA